MKPITDYIRTITILFAMVFYTGLLSQNINDNLENIPTVESFNNLIKLSRSYMRDSTEKSVEYGKQAINMALQLGDNTKIAAAMLNTATAYYYLENYDSCEIHLLKATSLDINGNKAASMKGYGFNMLCIINKNKGNLEDAFHYGAKAIEMQKQSGNKRYYGSALVNFSTVLKKTGRFNRALDSLYKALNIFIELKDTVYEGGLYSDIANLYLDMGNDSMGTEYYYKAKKAMEPNNTDIPEYANIVSNIGISFYNKKEYDSAIACYKKAMIIYKAYDSQIDIAIIYQNIGNAQVKKLKHKDGLTNLKFAMKTFKKHNLEDDMANVSLDIGNAFLGTKEYDSSAKYMLMSLETSSKIGSFYVRNNALKSLSKLYEATGNYKKSMHYFKTYIAEKDSVMSKEVQDKILELKTRYETGKKENMIQKLKNEQSIQKAKEKNLVFMIILILTISILVIVIFMFKRKKDKDNEKHRLETQKIREDNLRRENEYKSNQLATHALNMIQRNKLFHKLQSDLSDISQSLDADKRLLINRTKKEINKSINTEKDWMLFKRYFEYINQSFYQNLNEKYPNLTIYEIRLAALIKLNLNTSEIAAALNIAPNSVKTARYRLKKKMLLEHDDDLFDFIRLM